MTPKAWSARAALALALAGCAPATLVAAPVAPSASNRAARGPLLVYGCAHGQAEAAVAYVRRIADARGWYVRASSRGDEVTIEGDRASVDAVAHALAAAARTTLHRVRDGDDPLATVADDAAPEGVSVYAEAAPLGPGRTVVTHFAAASGADGPLRAFLAHVEPPAGTRFALGELLELGQPGQGLGAALPAGARSFLLEEPAFLTSAHFAAVEAKEGGAAPGDAYVSVTLDDEGRAILGAVTAANIHRRIAIVVGDRVVVAAVVASAVTGGRVSITMGAERPDALGEARALAERIALGVGMVDMRLVRRE